MPPNISGSVKPTTQEVFFSEIFKTKDTDTFTPYLGSCNISEESMIIQKTYGKWKIDIFRQ